MVYPAFRCHGGGRRSFEEFIRLIETARTVELLAFSPDEDPLAMVQIGTPEALALIAMQVTMGHVFRASNVGADRVFVEAIELFQRS